MFEFGETGIALTAGEIGYWQRVVVTVLLLALAATGRMAVRQIAWTRLAEGVATARTALRLESLPMPLFVMALLLWAAMTLVLVAGLVLIVLSVILSPAPAPASAPASAPVSRDALWEFRFRLAQLAVLTTVLGALVALPITLNRLKLSREANETAKGMLFNTQIAQAAADLHAQRQVTRQDKKNDGKFFNAYEDDVIRRNAAIDRLEGLVKERSGEAERVARLLSVYVREMSREYQPVKVPETVEIDVIREWARGLKPARSDMENAVKVLGRLTATAGLTENTLPIDLRGANLQGFDMHRLDLRKADLHEAQMQGAVLVEAQMQGAVIVGAQMQGAVLDGAQIQGANLGWAQMQGANLHEAQMQKASLFRAQMQGANLAGAQMQGADLSGARMQGASLVRAQMQGANLGGAQMRGAFLRNAQMQGTDLRGAEMRGANLSRAQMQGTDLEGAHMDNATDLTGTTVTGASVRSVDDTTMTLLKPFWGDIFADVTVDVPEAERPGHWADEDLDWVNFHARWRAWQREIGFDPDKPE